MKSFFKLSAIGMVVLGLAGNSYSAMSHQSNANNLMWPPKLNGVFIGVDVLDLAARNGDLDYLTSVPVATTGVYNTKAVSANYNWNWRVYAGIKFADNDDITISWLQMNNTNRKSAGIIDGKTYLPRWLFGNDWNSIYAKAKFSLNEAYGVWGHTINFNNPWSLRFAAGIEYAGLDSDLMVNAMDATVVLPDTGINLGYKSKTELSGWGPRFELDTTYHLPYGLAWFTRTNAALLVSTRQVSLNVINNDFGVTPVVDNLFATDIATRNVVIPKLGMKIGVSYSYVFGQVGAEGCSATTLSLEAGWQVDTYIHAVERPVDSFAGLPNPIPSALANTRKSNFTEQGLFIGIKVNPDWL